MRRFDDEDLTGAEFRECDLSGARLVGVVMQDAEIDGLVTNLVVNGVQVMPYVEAELDRRHPVAPAPRYGAAASSGRRSRPRPPDDTRCGCCSGPTSRPTCGRPGGSCEPTGPRPPSASG